MARKNYRKTKKSALSKREESKVKSIVNRTLNRTLEWKHHDLSLTHAPSNVGAIYDYTNITQGDSQLERIGAEIKAYSLSFRAQVINADHFNILRFIFFQYQADTSPVVSDVLDTVGAVGLEYLANYNLDNVGKSSGNIRILYDKTVVVNENFAGDIKTSRMISAKVNVKHRTVRFNEALNTGNNKVWFLSISDSALPSHATLNIVSRMWYTDA